MPGDGRRAASRPPGWTVVLLMLLARSCGARAACVPVAAEFVLTALGNPDGNRANHEIGICLPQFSLNLTSSCVLTLRPRHAGAAYVSLLTAGHEPDGTRVLPLANDAPARVNDAVNNEVGYYYLQPRRCPQAFSGRVKGAKLLSADVASLLRRGLGVSTGVLPTVAFTSNGLTVAWHTSGPRAQELSYTAVRKVGGPTLPDFAAYRGGRGTYCSLLDINPALNLDSNPADGIVDDSTASLVGRIPRPIPGRAGYYICAIAPAGGFVRATRVPAGLDAGGGGPRYRLAALRPNAYATCGGGGYLYRLGAVNAAGDAATDHCTKCPRGSYAAAAAALCAPCAPGSYNDRTGQRSCRPCQFGYAPYGGALRCMDCYYGRPFCSEGFSPSDGLFSCNSERLPEGYSPDAGFSLVRPLDSPTEAAAAAKYAPMFRRCSVRGGGASLLALNVSAECRVKMYVLGDVGRGGGGSGCSQDAEGHAITAHFTAPNIVAGLSTRGLGGWRVGFVGRLNDWGLDARVFAAGLGGLLPPDLARPTRMTLALPESGWGYLGGGDNGQGLNANLKGVNYDPCPPGTLKEMLNGDGVEDPGEDPNSLLSHYCVPCGVGTFCPGADPGRVLREGEAGEGSGPQNCPAGTFGGVLGAKDASGCLDCPVGTYQDMDGSFTCNTCAPNTFASSPGSTECVACGDGYEVAAAGANFCNPCQPGSFRDSAASDACDDCPPGSSSAEAAGQCSVCEPGTFAPSPRSAACTECPRGSFQRTYGARACTPCPVGTYGDSRGRSSCKVCPVGTFNAANGSESATDCQRCPVGKAAPRPGSGACSNCGAGYFSDRAGAASCRACPAGSYTSAPGSHACTQCPRGTYADKSAARGCRPCPVGFFAAAAGSARCMSCPAGAFNSQPGSASCSRCPAGSYSTRAAAGSPVACAPCPAGTFSFQDGASQCLQCAAGQFAPGAGSRFCDACPLGTYAPGPGSQRCLPCKAGYTTARLGAVGAGECAVRVQLNG